MSLSIPQAPNAGLFKQGYNTYVHLEIYVILKAAVN
jgi:hypothetical protein